MINCSPRCIASKLLILGLVLVLARLYTEWDIWVVIGTILIIKAVVLFLMPAGCCNTSNKKKK